MNRKSKRKKILILGASEEMIPLMDIARSEGYLILVTDRDCRSKGLEYADVRFNLDATDVSSVMAIAVGHQIDAVLTRTELLLPVAAHICAQRGLPGPSVEVAALSVDKHLFRNKMACAKIRTPKFYLMEKASEVKAAIDITGFPAIVKPVDYSGSIGVTSVSTLQEAKQAWENAKEVSPSGRVIVEQLLEGREVSVETWTEARNTHIAAITGKTVSDNGHYVELRHTIPARLNPFEAEAIKAEVQKMAAVMQLNQCLAHTEIILTTQGPVIIETAARPGGDLIGLRMVEMATGINMNKVMLYLALGKKVPEWMPRHRATSVQYVTSYNRSFAETNHDILTKDPNFAGYSKLRDDDPERLSSSADRLAYYLFRAENLEELEQSLKPFDEQ